MFKMQRINLLKFLCDEMLNTALIREHIDQCADKLNDLHQTVGMLYPWLFFISQPTLHFMLSISKVEFFFKLFKNNVHLLKYISVAFLHYVVFKYCNFIFKQYLCMHSEHTVMHT
jgi:hypothetical protein